MAVFQASVNVLIQCVRQTLEYRQQVYNSTYMDDENTNDVNSDDQTDDTLADAVDEDDDTESDGGAETDIMPEQDVPDENLNPSAPPNHEAPDAV
jgi:hypothetical protein